jgi:hypothetical protein
MKMKSEVSNRGLEWINLIVGIGFAGTAFMSADVASADWNAGIVGALIAFCSAAALYRYGAWTEWSNIILGSWAIASPFVLGFSGMAGATWTCFAVGICVATVATLQLLAGRRVRPSSRTLDPST